MSRPDDVKSGSDFEVAFRAGFEHAVAGGDEASKRHGIPRDSLPLVLYFATEADRRELIDAVQAYFGANVVTIKIPERRS